MGNPGDVERIDELILAQRTILATINMEFKGQYKDHFTAEELALHENTMKLEAIYHDAFPKMLLVCIGSNFEYRMVEILDKILDKSCPDSFFFAKLVKQHILGTRNFSRIINIPSTKEKKFYTAINILTDDDDYDSIDNTSIISAKNNAIVISKHIFGNIEGFKEFIQGKIKQDDDLGKNIVAFASIVARRNILIHNNLLYYDKNKIGMEEIQELYRRGNKFIDSFYQMVEQFQEIVSMIKDSSETKPDMLRATINEKYHTNIDKDWIAKFR